MGVDSFAVDEDQYHNPVVVPEYKQSEMNIATNEGNQFCDKHINTINLFVTKQDQSYRDG